MRGVRQEFAGTLTIRENKTHVAHELVLPRGAARLSLRLEAAAGPGLGHMVCVRF